MKIYTTVLGDDIDGDRAESFMEYSLALECMKTYIKKSFKEGIARDLANYIVKEDEIDGKERLTDGYGRFTMVIENELNGSKMNVKGY